MRLYPVASPTWLGALLIGCVLLSCSCASSASSPAGVVLAHVSVNGAGGEQGKLIEIVGTGEAKLTGRDGSARFAVPAGHYVVRAFALNRPGPPPAYIDLQAEVLAGHVTSVEFSDCPDCVSPEQ